MMKEKLIATILVFVFIHIANAQIKVVGDEYMDSLTATKNYFDRDIDFDRVFPPVLPRAKKNFLKSFYNDDLMDINLTGDTLLLLKPYKLCNQEFATNSLGKAISTFEIPSGYYVISGFVFCIENEKSVREAAGLPPYDYGNFWPKGEHPNDKNIRQLKKEMLLNGKDKNQFVKQYLRYIILTSIDTENNKDSSSNYYCSPLCYDNPFGKDKNIYLRFYNEACKFIGEKMVYGRVAYDSLRIKKVLTDDITGEPIKLNDNSYVVKDVVMKESSLFLILQGEKTGSFAQKIEELIYGYDKNDFTGVSYGYDKNDFTRISRSSDSSRKRDIAGFLMDFHESIYWLSKKDVEPLYKRPKIAQAQREKNRQIRINK